MIWSIDDSLRLTSAAELPFAASAIDCPEQLTDTVLLRNLSVITESLFSNPSLFLFHSTEYWGPFDVGCVLKNGSFLCFENKAKSVRRKGFTKFLEDINTVTEKPKYYAAHRFGHVLEHHDEYIATAERMFSSFFLRLRCDNVKQSRNLTSEAADFLNMPTGEFRTNFDSQIDWLKKVEDYPDLDSYLESFLGTTSFAEFIAIFLIAKSSETRVRKWISESSNIPPCALLGTYQFYRESADYPSFLSVEMPTPMAAQNAG